MDSKKKSFLKSAIWRVWGVIFLAMVTYAVTGNLITTTAITFVHHFMFLWIYYFHERAWFRVKNETILKYKKWIRPFTYEIILGNMVLGTISWIFTGSWTAVTLITLTYIGNKLWMYVVYDYLWELRNKRGYILIKREKTLVVD